MNANHNMTTMFSLDIGPIHSLLHLLCQQNEIITRHCANVSNQFPTEITEDCQNAMLFSLDATVQDAEDIFMLKLAIQFRGTSQDEIDVFFFIQHCP